ncbi:MAG TPA: glycosyltransferase family 4 protein [Gemmatimonadaceae bacterium]|nr:glycosyltransferase family 4 protein [Gemmatimonadaceae bacterium]
MRVLVVTHNYPRFAGDPAGAFVARLAAAAQDAGHEVRVLAPHAPGTAAEAREGGVLVTRFRYAPEPLERVGYRGDLHRSPVLSPVALLGVPAMLLAFRRALRRLVREFHPDIVHAHWWIPSGWVTAGAGDPFIVTCHGSDVRLLERARAIRALGGRVLARASAVTTVSHFLAEDVRTLLPALRTPVRVLPMPIDMARFAAGRSVPKASPPRILYAGNLIPSKGVADLVSAFALLRGSGVECQLRVLGEGPSAGELREIAHSLGVDDAIQWFPFVSQDAMPAEYGASSVTVLPTRGRAEGLGLTLVEALAAGCAVVGTPAGGIPEVVIDGRTGLIARDSDPGDLARQLRTMLTDDPLRACLTAEGQRHVESIFAPERAAANYIALYHDIVDGRVGV